MLNDDRFAFKLEVRDFIYMAVVLAGFLGQAFIVRNDVQWIKESLMRHERLIENLIARKG